MRRLVPIVLCFALACGSDAAPTQPVTASLVGTWSLHDINGLVLPVVLTQNATTKTEMLSDIVTATAAGTYTEVAQVRTTVNGQATVSSASDTGTYTVTGNAVVVHSNNDGSSINGTIKGDTFTIAANGIAFEYRKQ
jgi:hypothetical protein